jgi:hypothetical protein
MLPLTPIHLLAPQLEYCHFLIHGGVCPSLLNNKITSHPPLSSSTRAQDSLSTHTSFSLLKLFYASHIFRERKKERREKEESKS